MENISSYLKKFQTILFKGEENSRVVREEIEKLIPVSLEEKDVEIKGQTVYVKFSAGLKSELFLKKNILLKNLHDRGLISIKDLL